MAVTITYSVDLIEQLGLNPLNGFFNPDAASLANGGWWLPAKMTTATPTSYIYTADAGSAPNFFLRRPGIEPAISELSNNNLVLVTDNGGELVFSIHGPTGLVSVQAGTGEVFGQLLNVDVAGLTGGGFVAAAMVSPDGVDHGIRVYLRNQDGSMRATFSVDASIANDDQNPSVAGLADGGFVVAWHRNVGTNSEMHYAVYNADGSVRLAPTVLDDAGTINRNASVAALDNGGFAIAYEDRGTPPSTSPSPGSRPRAR